MFGKGVKIKEAVLENDCPGASLSGGFNQSIAEDS